MDGQDDEDCAMVHQAVHQWMERQKRPKRLLTVSTRPKWTALKGEEDHLLLQERLDGDDGDDCPERQRRQQPLLQPEDVDDDRPNRDRQSVGLKCSNSATNRGCAAGGDGGADAMVTE